MDYKIYMENVEVGSVRVERQGLYYCVHCSCKQDNSAPYRVFINSECSQRDLGICPPGGQITVRFPVKKIGEGELVFFAAEETSKNFDGWLIQEDVPFPYLKKLPQAYLRQCDGKSFLAFKD